MRKILIYVDAENVTTEQMEGFADELAVNAEYRVIGKFYGDHEHIGNITEFCTNLGYDYVDTHNFVSNNKNVADMKIVVDCMDDVHNLFKDQVQKVFVLSSDHDFVPLALKMISTGISFELPLLSQRPMRKTLADLNMFLRNNSFTQRVIGRVFEPVFCMIRELCGDEFSDSLIESLVGRKRKCLLDSWINILPADKVEQLKDVPVRDFSLLSIMQVLGLETVDFQLADDYTRKMFGICLSNKNITDTERLRIRSGLA